MWRNEAYSPSRRLGSGYQSCVWLATEVSTGRLVTVKATNLEKLESSKSFLYLREEQACLTCFSQELNNNNNSTLSYNFSSVSLRVPKLINVFHEQCQSQYLMNSGVTHKHQCETNTLSVPHHPNESITGTVFFVYEFIPGTTLNKHIAIENGFDETRAKFHAAELICILGAIHERGYIYRDLKASNVIVQPNGRLSLIDFGFAKKIGIRGRCRSFCGTLHAMAPEIFLLGDSVTEHIDGLSYNQRVDVINPLDSETTNSISDRSVTTSESQMIESDSLLSKTDYSLDNTSQPHNLTNPIKKTQLLSVSTPSLSSSVQPLLYGTEVDWWSLGIIIFEMIYCFPPFGYRDRMISANSTVKELAVISPDSIIFPDHKVISIELKSLIVSLLQAQPSKRLGFRSGARDIQQAPWFNEFPWEKLYDESGIGPNVFQFPVSDY